MAVSLKVVGKTLYKTLWSVIKKSASFLSSCIIIISAVVVVLYLIRIKPYVVTTGSMEPAIPVRSICFVNEKISLESISVGEVISFRLGDDTLVTHRVTSINGGDYTTKGDANNTEDSAPVTKENYVGKTVFVIPFVGVVLIFLHSTRGMIAAVTVILLLIIISFIPKGKNETKPEMTERQGRDN